MTVTKKNKVLVVLGSFSYFSRIYGEYLSERFEIMICEIAKTIAKIAANAPAIVLKMAVIGSLLKLLKLMLWLLSKNERFVEDWTLNRAIKSNRTATPISRKMDRINRFVFSLKPLRKCSIIVCFNTIINPIYDSMI